jgi:hypothetical protein
LLDENRGQNIGRDEVQWIRLAQNKVQRGILEHINKRWGSKRGDLLS